MKAKNLFIRNFLPLIFLASLALSACQQNSGGGSAPPPVGVAVACPTCGVVGGSLLVGVHSMTPDGLILFSLDVQGNVVQPCYQPANLSVICAQGQSTVVGTMRVTTPSTLYCNLPAGDYNITPLQVSTISMGTLIGGQYQATGPANMTFRLSKGILMNSSGSGLDISSTQNRIAMGLFIDSVNGVSCGIMSTE